MRADAGSFTVVVRTTLTLLVLAPMGDRLHAQDATAQVAFAGGIGTDQRGVRSNALTVAPSFFFTPGNRVSVQLSGSATRYASPTFSLGAGGSITGQEAIGRFVVATLTGSGSVSRLQGAAYATFGQADVVPALELRLWRTAFFGGIRAASGMVTQQEQGVLPFGNGPATAGRTNRSGIGPVFGGVVALGDEQTTLRLAAREERLLVGGAVLPERTLSASLGVALTAVVSLELAAGRYDGNRMVGTPAGEYVSAGISLRMGGSREPTLPAAHGARRQPAGTTRLSIRAPDAERVEIAGDFNEWTPTATTRAANGVWYADLTIPPGQYRYAFRVNGAQWRVPDGATAVDDGFGGKSAWLTVSSARSRQ